MSLKDKRKLSCTLCRKIKRKCDGELPCSNCTKRGVQCEYNQTDRRSQRFSIGYIKSLETNNEVYESTLSHLVSLRDDPDELKAKLDSLASSFPLPVQTGKMESYSRQLNDEIKAEDDDSNVKPIVDQSNFFGPGSIYHFNRFSRPDREPMLKEEESLDEDLPPRATTLEENYEYVADIVRTFFERQYPTVLLYILDKETILRELENRTLDGPFLCPELIYAICANCEGVSYDEADAYYNLVIRMLFFENLSLSVAIAQCYTLMAVHAISKGQISKGWLLAGLAVRVGLDVGFDMYPSEAPCSVTNRFYMGSILIDTYICMAVGRRTSIAQYMVPIMRLQSEPDVDYLNLKYAVELVEMSRTMIRSTYQPVMFDADPKINYLLKFNRSKAFNVKMLKWKSKLDPVCHWLYPSMKASKNLATENHTVKYMYYYLLIFLNKPFLHVPKQHSTLYIIEEISKEMVLIVRLQLERMEAQVDSDSESDLGALPMVPFTQSDTYQWASMDVCMLTLLTHAIVTLMITQPQHYLYLEKHFKVFVRYLNIKSPRKYKAEDNPIKKLHETFVAFKAKLKNGEIVYELSSPAYDMDPLREAIESDNQEQSSPSQSDDLSLGQNRSSETSTQSGSVKREFSESVRMGQTDTDSSGISQEDSQRRDSKQVPQYQVTHPTQVPPQMPVMSNEQAFANPVQVAQLVPPMGPQMMDLEPRNYDYAQFLPQQELQNMGGEPRYNEYSQFMPRQEILAFDGQPRLLNPQEQSVDSQYFGQLQEQYQSSIAFHNYDQLPPPLDPVHKMMNTLFSNTGQEFAPDKDQINWDRLFQEQYLKMS